MKINWAIVSIGLIVVFGILVMFQAIPGMEPAKAEEKCNKNIDTLIIILKTEK